MRKKKWKSDDEASYEGGEENKKKERTDERYYDRGKRNEKVSWLVGGFLRSFYFFDVR